MYTIVYTPCMYMCVQCSLVSGGFRNTTGGLITWQAQAGRRHNKNNHINSLYWCFPHPHFTTVSFKFLLDLRMYRWALCNTKSVI